MPARCIFGHPEFWDKVHTKFRSVFEAIAKVDDARNSLLSRQHTGLTPNQKVLFYLTEITGFSLAEVVLLVGNGYGPGAVKIARSMLEYAVNEEYLRICPDEIEDFLGWHWLEQSKVLRYAKENDSALYARFSPELIAQTEEQLPKARKRFEYRTQNGEVKRRHNWCKLNLSARSEKTQYLKQYRLVHPLASQIMHGTIGGLSFYAASDSDGASDAHLTESPPRLDWCAQALEVGHWCSLGTIQTLSRSLAIEPVPSVNELVCDFKQAWKKVQ